MTRDPTDYTAEDERREKLADALEQERRDNPVCPYCDGDGWQYLDGGRLQWKCPDCEGTGGILDEDEIEEDE